MLYRDLLFICFALSVTLMWLVCCVCCLVFLFLLLYLYNLLLTCGLNAGLLDLFTTVVCVTVGSSFLLFILFRACRLVACLPLIVCLLIALVLCFVACWLCF